jgi:hypothetical protein
MRRASLKAALVAAGLGALAGGCATTVDMGGPLGHYRYHYDSRPTVYHDDAITYPAPTAVYRAPAVVDREDD